MFVQIIEGRTTDAAGLRRQGERWQEELRPGAIGFVGVTSGVTPDGRAVTVVRFESQEAAEANAARPEQGNWWAETEKYYDGEVTFTNSTDTTTWMGGGSNDAGFVQVMKSNGVDRARVEAMDAALELHASERPDIIGGHRIWTGPGSCIDVAYFTSEAEARAGESAEMSPAVAEVMAEFDDVMGATEYLDLTEPVLH